MNEPEKTSTEGKDAALDRDAVTARAYAIYVRRGMKPGHDLDDWIEAERQLRSEAIRSAVAKAAPAATPAAPATTRPAQMPSPRPTGTAPASPAEAPAAGTSKKKKPRKR